MDPVITTHLETIRAAFVDGASSDQRRAATVACRTLAAVLEAAPGQPLATIPTTSSTLPNLAALLPHLRQLDVDQVLDLVIAKLSAKLPTGTELPKARSYPVPALGFGGAR